MVDECPAPVLTNGSSAINKTTILDRKLLVTRPDANVAATEGERRHVTTAAILHPYTLTPVGTDWHLEVNTAQARSLSHLVMDSGTLSIARDLALINDQVRHGSEKVVLIGVPVAATRQIRVLINH